MTIRTILCFLCVLSLRGPSAHAQLPWTPERTAGRAVEVSARVTTEAIEADQAALDRRNAAAGRYPSVLLSGTAGVTSEVMEIALPGRTIRFGDYDSYAFALGVQQLLYDGGAIAASERAASDRIDMNEAQRRAAALTTERAALLAFWSVVASGKTLEADREAVTEAAAHRQVVEARVRQGMALEVDELRASLRVSQAVMDTVSRTAEHRRAEAAFRAIVDIDPSEPLNLAWDDEADPCAPAAIDTTGLAGRRPEFRTFDAMMRTADDAAERARAQSRPRVGLLAAANYGRPGLNLPENNWMHWFSAQVNVSWNVWDWGVAERNAEQAELDRRKAAEERADFARNLHRALVEVAAVYDEAVEHARLAAEAERVARAQLDSVTAAYRAGAATETDYGASHAAFTRASLEAAAAQVNCRLARVDLRYTLGMSILDGGTR